MQEFLTVPSDVHVYAVLGAHRSGTSWLAGSLQEKGLELGEVNTAARYNEKGNRENERLWRIHEEILRASGGSWRQPPEDVRAPEAAMGELRAFVADMDARFGRWGFKDPRSVLVLGIWRQLVPSGIGRVGIYRHPAAVAASLIAREPDVMDEKASARLWLAYNERLVQEHRRDPFPILRFDVERDRLLRGLDAVARSWALPFHAERSTFFDPGLRHGVDDGADRVPSSCLRCWEYLEANTLEV
jgi:hypothetical protein